MLMGGDRCALAEATHDLISDLSAESWERFQVAKEKALREGQVSEDQV
jgi:hypothetical protein